MRNVPLVLLESIGDVKYLTPDVSVVAVKYDRMDETDQDDLSLGLFRGLTPDGILSLTHNSRKDPIRGRNHYIITRGYNLARMVVTKGGRLNVNGASFYSKDFTQDPEYEKMLMQRAGLYDDRAVVREMEVQTA